MAGGCREWVRANDVQRVGNMGSSYFLSPGPEATLIKKSESGFLTSCLRVKTSILLKNSFFPGHWTVMFCFVFIYLTILQPMSVLNVKF